MALTVGPGGTSRKKKTDQEIAEDRRLRGESPTSQYPAGFNPTGGGMELATGVNQDQPMVSRPGRSAPVTASQPSTPSATEIPAWRYRPLVGGGYVSSGGLAGDMADAFITRTRAAFAPDVDPNAWDAVPHTLPGSGVPVTPMPGGTRPPSGTAPVTPMPSRTRQPPGTVPVTAMPGGSGSGTASPPSTGEGPTWGQAPGERGMFDPEPIWEQMGLSQSEWEGTPSIETNTTEQNNRELEQMYRDQGMGETGVNFQTTSSSGSPIYSSSGVYAKEGDPRQGRWQLSADMQAKVDASDNPQQTEENIRRGLNASAGQGDRAHLSNLIRKGYTPEQGRYMIAQNKSKNVAQTKVNQGRYDKARQEKWQELNSAYGNREMSRREHGQQWADFNRQWGDRGVQAHLGRPKPRPGVGQPLARRGPQSGWNSGQSGINMNQDTMMDPTDTFGGGQGDPVQVAQAPRRRRRDPMQFIG